MLKVAVLCNSRLGLPAIQHLAASGQLMACAGPNKLNEETEEIAYVCNHAGIDFRTFSKHQLAEEMDAWISRCKADVVLVFTFPYRIPEKLLNKPKYGFINFHFGLLPAYRGADAIFWQIRNREQKGGITVHKMIIEFDAGPVYLRNEIPIHPQDTYGRHCNHLAMAAPQLVLTLLQMLSENKTGIAQDKRKAHYYPRPALKDVFIDWTKSSGEIIAQINACNPWNRGAISSINHYPVRVISATKIPSSENGSVPGQVVKADSQNGLCVACGTNEQIRLDICLINNEFAGSLQMSHCGLYPGMIFMPVMQLS